MENSTLIFIWHVKQQEYFCICGEKIGHDCSVGKLFDKIKFINCNPDFCDICKKSRYEDQWIYDRDGYSRCLVCYCKCEIDCLPKECECVTYIQCNGISKCKSCEQDREEDDQDHTCYEQLSQHNEKMIID